MSSADIGNLAGAALQGMTRQLLSFLAVGTCGLALDAGLFTLLAATGAPEEFARIVSLAAATFVTWRLNRGFTFSPSGRTQPGEGGRYVLVALGAQGISYLIFVSLRWSLPGLQPLLALLAGAALATAFSFTGQKFMTFRNGRFRW